MDVVGVAGDELVLRDHQHYRFEGSNEQGARFTRFRSSGPRPPSPVVHILRISTSKV